MSYAESGAVKYARMSQGIHTVEELRSTAMFALVKAVRSFDPSRGAAVKSWVFSTVDGYLRHHHRIWKRQNGWTWHALGEGSHGPMEHVLHIDPWPINEEGEEIDLPADSVDVDEQIHRRTQREAVLRNATNERERVILSGLFEGWTMDRIGEELGLSRGRIHQLIGPALARAKAKFSPSPKVAS
jgi:RNA polymerase sigma factor (sigma-70 family)